MFRSMGHSNQALFISKCQLTSPLEKRDCCEKCQCKSQRKERLVRSLPLHQGGCAKIKSHEVHQCCLRMESSHVRVGPLFVWIETSWGGSAGGRLEWLGTPRSSRVMGLVALGQTWGNRCKTLDWVRSCSRPVNLGMEGRVLRGRLGG